MIGELSGCLWGGAGRPRFLASTGASTGVLCVRPVQGQGIPIRGVLTTTLAAGVTLSIPLIQTRKPRTRGVKKRAQDRSARRPAVTPRPSPCWLFGHMTTSHSFSPAELGRPPGKHWSPPLAQTPQGGARNLLEGEPGWVISVCFVACASVSPSITWIGPTPCPAHLAEPSQTPGRGSVSRWTVVTVSVPLGGCSELSPGQT